MNKYTVSFTHVINRYVTCEVLADSEKEAIEKAKECDWEDCDEDMCPEDGIETLDYKIVKEQ